MISHMASTKSTTEQQEQQIYIYTQKGDRDIKSADGAILHMVAPALEDGRVAARRRPHQHRMISHGGVGPLGALRRREHRRRSALVVRRETTIRRRWRNNSNSSRGRERGEGEAWWSSCKDDDPPLETPPWMVTRHKVNDKTQTGRDIWR